MTLRITNASLYGSNLQGAEPDNEAAGTVTSILVGKWDDGEGEATLNANVQWWSEGSAAFPLLDPTKRYDVLITEHVEELPIEETP